MEWPVASAARLLGRRLYLDEDLWDDLGVRLRATGLDAVHTRELGRKGANDPRQMAFAVEESRVVVTANLIHLRMLHQAWVYWAPLLNPDRPRLHPGIFVVPNPNAMPAGIMARLLADLVGDGVLDAIENRLLQWRIGQGLRDLSRVR